jgi:hypothetical protein
VQRTPRQPVLCLVILCSAVVGRLHAGGGDAALGDSADGVANTVSDARGDAANTVAWGGVGGGGVWVRRRRLLGGRQRVTELVQCFATDSSRTFGKYSSSSTW